MAHGLPDYYRGVDIAYQALAQLMVRPTYGAAKNISGHKVVTASAETELCSVTGRGMIYGGVLYLIYTSSQKDGRPLLYIDGQELGQLRFEYLYRWKMLHTNTLGWYLLYYNDVRYEYGAGLSPNFTFETSFKVAYEENNTKTPDVCYNIDYALII